MLAPPSISIENRLLAAMPTAEHEQFTRCCDAVTLVSGDVLAEPQQPLGHVFFPSGGFISMIASTDELARLQVGLIGNEGMLGASMILGTDESVTRAVVQGGGPALRVDLDRFRRMLTGTPVLERVMKSYLHVLVVQLAQASACSHYHRLEARVARWLLMTQDRAHCGDFRITHQLLAHLLGVRRAGVSEAAASLQRRGLIRYHRGHVTILDRNALEGVTCGCYSADRDTYDRAMDRAIA